MPMRRFTGFSAIILNGSKKFQARISLHVRMYWVPIVQTNVLWGILLSILPIGLNMLQLLVKALETPWMKETWKAIFDTKIHLPFYFCDILNNCEDIVFANSRKRPKWLLKKNLNKIAKLNFFSHLYHFAWFFKDIVFSKSFKRPKRLL